MALPSSFLGFIHRRLTFLLTWAALATPCLAHEKWVKHDLLSPFDRRLFEGFTVLNTSTLIGVVVVVALAWRASMAVKAHDPAPDTPPNTLQHTVAMLLGVLFGAGCLYATVQGQYLAPDLVGDGSLLANLLVWGMGILSVFLIFGLFTVAASWGTIALFVLAVLARPFEHFDGAPVSMAGVFNYIDVVGIALFFVIVGRGRFGLGAKLGLERDPSGVSRARAVGILRVFTGLTLVVLGLQKFLIPELPMGVLQNYGDTIFKPFQKLTGCTPEQYVFGAFVVETSVGVLMILGLFTRTLMVVLAVLFTTTLVLFKGEVAGHAPLFGIVFVLLVEGGGRLRVGLPSPASLAAAVAPAAVLLLLPGLGACTPANGSEASVIEPTSTVDPEDGLIAEGVEGRFRFALRFSPPELGELFSIETEVVDVETGRGVEGGRFELDATMPAHGHGMMTAPQHREAGDGRYNSAGMKLHMHGSWELFVSIRSGGYSDRVRIPYEYQPSLPAKAE